MDAPPPPPVASRASLFRELADGSAGWGLLLVVSLALGVFLTGAALIAAYVITAMQSPWRRGGTRYVYADEELVAWLLVAASAVYLAAIAWLWSRKRRRRALWLPTVLTVGMTVLTIVLCVLLDQVLYGDEELVIGGVVLVAISAVLVLWVWAVRSYSSRPPVHNQIDGQPNVRCPNCGYRMVGLTESRCPECGTAYTLDQLLAQQDFVAPARQ